MSTAPGLEATDFDALDDILDDLRTRHDETPQWEFCEGFLAALVCCRRRIPEDEWLPVLLGLDEGGAFADAAQRERFLALWARRSAEVQLALDTEDGPLSVSEQRLNAYGDALWAVYDLREIWRNIGPRVQQVIKGETLGRNDPCSCGSGKKYKKCCGA